MGPGGLMALALPLQQQQLLEVLLEAQAFARDWAELRSITRNRMAGQVLPPCCADAVEQATAAAAAAAAAAGGTVGSGTARYLQERDEASLPPGVRLVPVTVHYRGGRQQLVTYKQGFDGAGRRLCLHCLKPVPDAVAAEDAVLEGALDLFCTLDCESSFYIKNSAGEAGKRERVVHMGCSRAAGCCRHPRGVRFFRLHA